LLDKLLPATAAGSKVLLGGAVAEPDDEKIKIELEVPKDEVHIGSVSSVSEASATEERLKKKAKAAEKKQKQAEDKIQELEEKQKKLKESQKTTVAGYEPSEIAKAPVEPPEPKDKKPPNAHQKAIIIFGFVLVGLSIILWPLFNFALFLGVAVAGAAIIAFGTLVRV